MDNAYSLALTLVSLQMRKRYMHVKCIGCTIKMIILLWCMCISIYASTNMNNNLMLKSHHHIIFLVLGKGIARWTLLSSRQTKTDFWMWPCYHYCL